MSDRRKERVLPTDTFRNLSDDKRNRILDAAIEEFAAHPYHRASVGRIVERAEIPKGSLYQYFCDKKDLYRYILQMGLERKLAYAAGLRDGTVADLGFFGAMRAFLAAGMEMARDYPRLSAIADSLMRDDELRDEMLGEFGPQGYRVIEELLERGIASGQISPDIDVPLVARLISAMAFVLADYVRERSGSYTDESLVPLYDEMLAVLARGIARKEST
jgi:AcrR family transcriptional regulator